MMVKSQQLSQRIQRGELPAVVLLYGPEQGLIDQAIVGLRRQVLGSEDVEDAFDAEVFHTNDLNQEAFFNACRALPFMAPKRWVLLKGVEKMDQKLAKSVGEYIKDPAPDSVLVIQSRNLEKRNPIRSACERGKKAWAVPFYEIVGRELEGWIRKELQVRGFQISQDGVAYLSQRLKGNTQGALQELEKLTLFMGEKRQIGIDETMNAVGDIAVHSVFSLAGATLSGNSKEALRLLDNLLELGEEPLMMLGLLATKLRTIAKATDLMKQGMAFKDAAKQSGVFWKEENQFAKQCRDYSHEKLMAALLHCQMADFHLKGGSPRPKREVMERLIINLALKRPAPPMRIK
ncbi:DNA polymerase III subunit delta [Magnetococcales bacterium HHB-1]